MKHVVKKNQTLLEALQEAYPDSSNSTLRKWLKNGRILVDGKRQKIATTDLEPGQSVEQSSQQKKIGPMTVLYEDECLVVIEKPKGLLSVATNFDTEKNAHAYLKRHYKGRVYVVHRLDQDTSGVMLFALTKPAMDDLKVQFANHSITRIYTAVVEGAVEENSGTWKSKLFEDDNYMVHSSKTKGELAISHYEVSRVGEGFSELKITLETGKKNQIRVHCKDAGYPVTGDAKYGAQENPLGRLALHATVLAFDHPVSGKRMTFESKAPWKFKF